MAFAVEYRVLGLLVSVIVEFNYDVDDNDSVRPCQNSVLVCNLATNS